MLITNKWKVELVILTHEHADHCIGVNQLYDHSPFNLMCSANCATNIGNSKQNLSQYIEVIDTFETHVPMHIVKDNEAFKIFGQSFTVIYTPGHSPGGACFYTNDIIFTGDTILNSMKTPLNYPHSNRSEYKASLKRLLHILNPGMIIYPGHGLPFTYFSEMDLII